MMLHRRAIVISLVLAVPAAALVTTAVEQRRQRDLATTLEGVVRSQVNEQVRERCEGDANWFLTGPLSGRPRVGEVIDPANADVMAPRPKLTDQAFELFAFDGAFTGTSMAAPRFPTEFRHALQRDSALVSAPFVSPSGTGVQVALPTSWVNGPCAYFLGRMRPPAGQWRTRVTIFGALSVLFAGIAWLAQLPVLLRVRRLSSATQTSIAEGHSTIAPDNLKDELSSVMFVYNDVATELHQRKARIADQDEALRRYVSHMVDDVSPPMAEVERHLSAISASGGGSNPHVAGALQSALEASARLENLSASARLRVTGELPRTSVDLTQLVERVLARYRASANAAGVTVTTSLPTERVTIEANEALIERAISNLLDNAIRYNRSGGRVKVALAPDPGPRGFSLRITDSGRGVSEEEFKGLTAVRRFRGDEAHNRRPGAPGLGRALTREIADRSGLLLELRRPSAGGFEAELSRR
jgi:signal transduction histidine kinase